MIRTVSRLFLRLLNLFSRLLALAIIWHTIVRAVRYFYKFPMPHQMANLIDNPWRRKIQPPGIMPIRHGIEPGMKVLEVGPGNGAYTMEIASWVGEDGGVIAIDIEPSAIERVEARAQAEGLENIEARVADVVNLPFADETFDAVTMMSVLGELPSPQLALMELYRVLKPGGVIAFSELLVDPDYPLARTVIALATDAGFRLKNQEGNFFSYTLVFEKVSW
ncbi:MAG TPA: class I SAM-dependent methyltransferase [Caldilineae bacterium]|nr:class I SAM-dependent methyltransferase [Caldilineae bacterium]